MIKTVESTDFAEIIARALWLSHNGLCNNVKERERKKVLGKITIFREEQQRQQRRKKFILCWL
jgi:hypothetical protein